MSDVNLVFTVSSVTSAITVDTTTVNVTPNTTAINMFAGYAAYPPNGVTGNSQVLFNDAGLFGGSSGFTYDKLGREATIDKIVISTNSNLGNVSNVYIEGGSDGQVLKTNGSGGLEWTTITPGGGPKEIQFNLNNEFTGDPRLKYDFLSNELIVDGDVSISGLTTMIGSLDAQGDVSFNNSSNVSLGSNNQVHIQGGNVGDILTTDGYGDLSWIPQAGGTGSGVPGGATYAIQFNNGAGVFGGTQSLTYIPSSGTINIQQVAEKATVDSAGSNGAYQYYLTQQSIVTKTGNALGNFTINFSGSLSVALNSVMDVGRSMSCVYMNKNGSTPYLATSFFIDGNPVTPIWFDGEVPGAGSPNSYDIYTFNIIKTGNNQFLLLATVARYY